MLCSTRAMSLADSSGSSFLSLKHRDPHTNGEGLRSRRRACARAGLNSGVEAKLTVPCAVQQWPGLAWVLAESLTHLARFSEQCLSAVSWCSPEG